MKPLFSIITVSYNSVNTIGRTIESLLSQTNQDYEYIIIDGESSDGTLDVIKNYEARFNGRMKYVSEPDNGIYDAMNKGIQQASGDIIGIVNSDDWLESEALAIVSEAFKVNGEKLNTIYCGWMNFHYINGHVQVLKTSQKLLKDKATSYIMAGIRHPAVFVTKKVYDEIGLFDTKMKITADTDFILRCYYNGIKFHFVDKVVTNMSDGGISNRRQTISVYEYKLRLNKFRVSKIRGVMLIAKHYLKELLIYYAPSNWIEMYRRR